MRVFIFCEIVEISKVFLSFFRFRLRGSELGREGGGYRLFLKVLLNYTVVSFLIF